MQWDENANAGFSEAEPWLPLASNFRQQNVAVESADPDSMLSLYKSLITLRRNEPALAAG